MEHKPERTTALVLAGGGSFGAVQVGMLKGLVETGFVPDFIVGSSVGALNGAYFAGAPDAAGVAKLESIWRSIKRQQIFPLSARSLAGFVRRRDFIFGSSGIRSIAEQNLPYRNLEDAKIPIHIVTTDVLSGDAVVLSNGCAADAIVASTAIPAAFPATRIGNLYLVDGAVTSNTPVRIAVALGARRLIVPTGFACNLNAPPQGAVASALHALTLLIARQLVWELEGLPREIDFAIIPSLCPFAGSPYDFGSIGPMIDAAETSTQDWIAAGGLNIRRIPQSLRAHSHQTIA